MNARNNHSRDAFTFSLRGVAAKSSFTFMPVTRDDRINMAWDDKLDRPQVDQPDTEQELPSFWGRFWLRGRKAA